MRVRVVTQFEPTLTAQMWRALLGPASVVEGLILTVTLGFVVVPLTLAVATRISRERIKLMNSKESK